MKMKWEFIRSDNIDGPSYFKEDGYYSYRLEHHFKTEFLLLRYYIHFSLVIHDEHITRMLYIWTYMSPYKQGYANIIIFYDQKVSHIDHKNNKILVFISFHCKYIINVMYES